jgi:D-alanine transaminase
VIVHLNGELVPLERARISPLDRGFVFGDGVYEGLRSCDLRSRGVARPHIVAIDRHVARMDSCLHEIGIPFDAGALGRMTQELLAVTGLRDAFIYWQVTRGTPDVAAGDTPRARVPKGRWTPTVFGMATPQPAIDVFLTEAGLASKTAVTMPDIRWLKGRIKSVSLLGNVIEAMEADARGVDDAILVRDGFVGEGLATNVVLALPAPAHAGGAKTELVTPTLESAPILAGVTRGILLDTPSSGLTQRAVRVEELARASEIMLLGSSTMVASVTTLDAKPVGDGKPGPAARGLLGALVTAILTESGAAGAGQVGGVSVAGARPIRSSR